jgi:hypothetical protein
MKVKTIFLITAMIFLISCGSKEGISREEFEKVELGMTLQEVKNILGEPYKKWTGPDGLDTYYFYVRKGLFDEDYAQVKFDKLGHACFSMYGKLS